MKRARKKLKAIYLTADKGIPVMGNKGASVHIRSLVKAWKTCGCEAVVVTTNLGQEFGLETSFKTVEVKSDQGINDKLAELRFPESNPNLIREIDCLYLNQALEKELLRLYSEIKYDFIYERYSLWSLAGAKASKKLKLPFLLEVNSPLVEEQKLYRSLELEPLARAIEDLNFHLADRIIAVSEGVKDYIVQKGVSAHKVLVLPNGVDPQQFKPQKNNRKVGQFHGRNRKARFVIGFVGSLKPWHGVRILVEAFQKLHDKDKSYHLLIVGDGPEKAYLEELTQKENLNGSMTLVGAVRHEQIPELMGAMDVAVAPYPELDNFYFSPLKLFEYMATGKPVVASASGQIKSIISHKKDGFLVPPGDKDRLAEAIEFIRNNPETARELGKNAAQKIRRNYTWQNNAEKILALAGKFRKKK